MSAIVARNGSACSTPGDSSIAFSDGSRPRVCAKATVKSCRSELKKCTVTMCVAESSTASGATSSVVASAMPVTVSPDRIGQRSKCRKIIRVGWSPNSRNPSRSISERL